MHTRSVWDAQFVFNCFFVRITTIKSDKIVSVHVSGSEEVDDWIAGMSANLIEFQYFF